MKTVTVLEEMEQRKGVCLIIKISYSTNKISVDISSTMCAVGKILFWPGWQHKAKKEERERKTEKRKERRTQLKIRFELSHP